MSAAARVKDAAWAAYVWPKGSIGNRVQGAVIGALESRRVRREWHRAGRILLVHTQGKVGSKAMFAALKAGQLPDDAVFHTHRINPDNLVGVDRERAGMSPRRTWYTAGFLGTQLRTAHDKDVVVLAAVRDPIERSLSAFLQNVERYGDSGRPITSATRVDLADLTRQFVQHFDPTAATKWVEVELADMFGIDLFATPFDHAAGYQILRRGKLRIGVIRHDRFADALGAFIRALTDLDPPEIGRVNDSSAKAYAAVHREMRETMRLPAQLVEATYDSHFARHFFTTAERAAAKRRWTVAPRPVEPLVGGDTLLSHGS